MPLLPSWPSGPTRDERPARPFTGYKLAHAVLSADGARTGFAGLTLGATRVYGVLADADCVWNSRHSPPRRWCGCGFYCLHELADARSLGCATENRSALLLEVAASGRYIRYERGLRYSRQRVRAVLDAQCGCGRAGSALADAGSGLIGWRHLSPVCGKCAAGRPVLTLSEFTARLDGRVTLAPLLSAQPLTGAGLTDAVFTDAGFTDAGFTDHGHADSARTPASETPAGETPFAVLSAEIALLHARMDDLQSRLERG